MRLQRFLDVSQSCDVETFERRLIGFAHELEFGIATAVLVSATPGQDPTVVSVGNTPESFKEASHNASDVKRDPVIRRLKSLSVPFIYDQDLYVEEGAADLWEQQAAYGYRTGIAVALHLPGHKHFLLGVDRSDPLPKDQRQLTRLMADLQLLAVHAQSAASALLIPEEDAGEPPKLTPRELEVLRWTMEGKSAWAVGEILGVTEHAVNFHMRSIFRKLGVSSKHHAVLKAVRFGLI